MRRLLMLLLLAPLTGCSAFADRVAFGDSVTFGWGGERGGWVDDVGRDLHETISNYGVPGETVAIGRHRLTSPLGPLWWPWSSEVLLTEGGNDLAGILSGPECRKRCPVDTIAPQIQAVVDELGGMVDDVRATGKNVYLGTYWRVNGARCKSTLHDAQELAAANAAIDDFDARVVQMAYEKGVPVARVDELDLEADSANFFDCMHPSADGYEKVAGVWEALLARVP